MQILSFGQQIKSQFSLFILSWSACNLLTHVLFRWQSLCTEFGFLLSLILFFSVILLSLSSTFFIGFQPLLPHGTPSLKAIKRGSLPSIVTFFSTVNSFPEPSCSCSHSISFKQLLFLYFIQRLEFICERFGLLGAYTSYQKQKHLINFAFMHRIWAPSLSDSFLSVIPFSLTSAFLVKTLQVFR